MIAVGKSLASLHKGHVQMNALEIELSRNQEGNSHLLSPYCVHCAFSTAK